MKAGRTYLLIGLAIAAAILVWSAIGRQHAEGSDASSNTAKVATTSRGRDLSAAAVLSIDIAKPSVLPRVASTASTLSQEFERARSLKPLYDRLSSPGGSTTADARFVLYEVLATCATRTDASPPMNRQKGIEARRKRLAQSIPESQPDRQRRLALFDELIAARCEGVEGVTTTTADLDKLLADAARDGDPKARALVVAREVDKTWVNPSPGMKPSDSGPSITDAQLQILRDAVASRDPRAIMAAGTALSNSFRDVVADIGPNHDELDGRAAMEAWRLLACEYGLECGAASRPLRAACVFEGHCGVATLPDLVFFYGTTPYQSQLVDSYRGYFRQAIESGDWSQVQFVRRPNEAGSRFYFGTQQGP